MTRAFYFNVASGASRSSFFGRGVLRLLFALALAFTSLTLCLCVMTRSANAESLRRVGLVRLEAPSHGPLHLIPGVGGFSAEFSIANDGAEPLIVSRIAALDPRAPPKLIARLVDGELPATIAPGAKRKALVRWVPETGVRVRQLFTHVIVTTSDEETGEVAIGVRAQLPGPLGPLEGRVVSLLVGIPLVGALLTLLLRALGRRDDRGSRLVAVTALAIQLALALYAYARFVAEVSRLDGNDGLQFIEHSLWIRAIAAEVFFGVDGTAVGPLVAISMVAFLAMLRERRSTSSQPEYYAAYLTLAAAVPGALCAMDGLLFVLFTAVAAFTATLLVSHEGQREPRARSLTLAFVAGLAVVLLSCAVTVMSRSSEGAFLVDGTKVSTTFNLPELSRLALGASATKLVGIPVVKLAFGCVLVASASLLGAFPFHSSRVAVLYEAPAAVRVLVSAALPTLGVCALVRLGCNALPEGMRWASGVVVALGAVTAVYGALTAFGQTDLHRLAASATTVQVGFVLVGIGSLTPQGLAGALVLTTTRVLTGSLLLLLVGIVHDRAQTSDVVRLAGIATQMRQWASVLVVAAFGQAGVMGFAGAWGPVLAVLGALPNYPPLAVVAALGLVLIATSHVAALSKVVFGDLSVDWETNALLEPFGGRFRDLTMREWVSVGPVALTVLVLGLWPTPLFTVVAGTVSDLTNALSPPGTEQISRLDGFGLRED